MLFRSHMAVDHDGSLADVERTERGQHRAPALDVGLAGIAVIAGNTIAAEPQAMIALADAKYLFIVGLPA